MRYDSVVFDLDGTLLDTLGDLTDSVNHILEAYGYPRQEPSRVRAYLGNGAERLMRGMLPPDIPEDLFQQILTEYGAYYAAHCEEKTGPYAGVLETLGKLREMGVRMAIVSNKGDNAVRILARHHFGSLIICAVGERPGIRRKPEPDSVIAALEQMRTPVEKALYVGDSEVDYETARRAGIDCALVDWGFRGRQSLEALHPDYLIHRPQMLVKICRGF